MRGLEALLKQEEHRLWSQTDLGSNPSSAPYELQDLGKVTSSVWAASCLKWGSWATQSPGALSSSDSQTEMLQMHSEDSILLVEREYITIPFIQVSCGLGKSFHFIILPGPTWLKEQHHSHSPGSGSP